MSVLLQQERKEKLQKILYHSSLIYKMDSKIEESIQMEIMLKNVDNILERPLKEMIMDFTEKKFLECCNDIPTALELIYGKYNDKKTFIYSSPHLSHIDSS